MCAHTNGGLMASIHFNAPPGWPTSPPGWTPPEGWLPDPAWPPAPPGWQWWSDEPQPAPWEVGRLQEVAPPSATPPYAHAGGQFSGMPALGHTPAIWWTEGLTRAGTWPDQPPGPGRSKGVRIFLTLLIALGPLVLLVVAVAGLTWTVNPADYPTDAAYQTAVDNRTGLATALMYLAYFVGYAVLATKVSFRWFDSLCLLIPIYSIIWQFRIAHRIAYLPHRDWQPRPDEVKSRSGSGPQRASGF